MSPRFALAIRKNLFVAGVRYARQDIAAAIEHGGGCKYFAFRGSPLAHGGVDGGGPLVDAFGVGVGDDEATRRWRGSIYVLLVEAVVGSDAGLELFLKSGHQHLLEHCGVMFRLIGLGR